MPRLVEAGACLGRAGGSTLPREGRRPGMTPRARGGGRPTARAVPPRSPEHLTQGGGQRGRGACQGSPGRGPTGAGPCAREAAEGSASQAAGQGGAGTAQRVPADQMGAGLGGLGRTWQDALPREELDQHRLPEGRGRAQGQARVRPLPSSPRG